MFKDLTKEQIGGLIVNAIFGAIGSLLIGAANMRANKKDVQDTVRELAEAEPENGENL